MTETLSDKIQEEVLGYDRLDVVPVKDVHEAVKKLNDFICSNIFTVQEKENNNLLRLRISKELEEIFGEKLIWAT